MHVELKHTLTVDKNAWWFRFIVWVWEMELAYITFCKLFWAGVFVVPGLILRGIFAIIERIIEFREQHKKPPKITMKLETPPPSSTPAGPSVMQRLLSKIEYVAARIVLAIKAAWGVIGMDGKLALFLGRVLIGIGLLIGLAALGAIVWLLVEFSLARFLVIGAIALVIVSALLCGIVYLLDRIGFWDVTGEGLGYGGRGIKRGALGFWGAMRAGYIAVKSSTCPKIEVRDDT